MAGSPHCKFAKWRCSTVKTLKKVGIFGTSGMAREAGDIAWAMGFEPIYVAKDAAEIKGCSLPSEVVLERDIANYASIPFALGIGDYRRRLAIAARFSGKLKFLNLVHPTATFGFGQKEVIDRSIGIIVAAGVRFTSGISVGNFSIFNQNAMVAHDCIIGDYVHLASGSIISGHVRLCDYCWVGAGAIVNQGTRCKKLEIGARTVIGSGSVVVGDCAPNSVYFGVPARKSK